MANDSKPAVPAAPAPTAPAEEAPFRWRWNVLVLVALGYGTICGIFAVLACGSLTAQEAYEVVQAPLMALIGGSLAIAKDLV